MCAISESEISVPMEISAAALRTASRSSGRMLEKSVDTALVRKPGRMMSEVMKAGKICIPMCRITLA